MRQPRALNSKTSAHGYKGQSGSEQVTGPILYLHASECMLTKSDTLPIQPNAMQNTAAIHCMGAPWPGTNRPLPCHIESYHATLNGSKQSVTVKVVPIKREETGSCVHIQMTRTCMSCEDNPMVSVHLLRSSASRPTQVIMRGGAYLTTPHRSS